MDRYAITFQTRPGSVAQVSELLARYPSPKLEINDGTRLLGTAVFLQDETVVRVMDVEGPLPVIARHLAQDPHIQQVERALNPHLEQPRDLQDPEGARRFFASALMARLRISWIFPGENLEHASRYAFVYPLKPGTGGTTDAIFTEGSDPFYTKAAPTRLLGTAVFRKDDLLVHIIDVAGTHLDAVDLLVRTWLLQEVGRQLGPYLQMGHDLHNEDGLRAFLTSSLMTVITDRHAPVAAGGSG